MKITQLTLRNFRNYQHCHLDLHPGLNILVGRNAQGKTNLLESVYFLSTGRSHRTSNQYDLIRWDTTGFFLHARISKRNLKVELDFSLSRDRRRQLKINGVVEKKLSALLGVLNSVLVSQVSPVYLYTLQQYNRALTQRNNLLKSFENRSVNRGVLETWNEQLIKYGARLTILRQRALAALAKHAKPSLYTISSGEENLCLVYRPWGYKIDLGDKEEEVSVAFREILERQYYKELRRKQTLVGPHRDDFQCLLNGIDVREFGSQGQQRSAVLAIKMAELEFMHEMTGDYPVLLLDDVLSELDSRRRQALLGLVDRGVQTLITGTEASLFTGWQDKSLLIAEISNGIISIVN